MGKSKPPMGALDRSLGELFKESRVRAGRSELYVVSYLGNISIETYREYEDGKRTIPKIQAYAISNCLGIPPDLVLKLLERKRRK